MNDIPNYIALPLGFVLSIVGAFYVNKYQRALEEWQAKRHTTSLLRQKSKAIAEYRQVVKLREDELYRFSYVNTTKMYIQFYAIFAIALLSVTLIFLGLGISFKEIIIGNAFDLMDRPCEPDQCVNIRYILKNLQISTAVLALVSLYSWNIRVLSFINTMSSLTNFEEFEKAIKEKWGDIGSND